MRKRLLVAALLTIMAVLTTHANADVIAWYRFENGANGTAATGVNSIVDSSGNGLNGTPVNGPVYRSVTGVPNSMLGLEFDGASQRVAIADDPKFQLTRSMTLEAFIRLTALPSSPWGLGQIIFRGDNRGGLDPYYLAVTGDGHLFYHIDTAAGASAWLYSSRTLDLNRQYHVAGTLDDATGNMALYIDGIQTAFYAGTDKRAFGALDPSWSPGLGIGNTQSGFPEYFPGIIDEVRISNTALAPGQFLNAVPEPSTLVLLSSLGLVGAVAAVYRRRRRAA